MSSGIEGEKLFFEIASPEHALAAIAVLLSDDVDANEVKLDFSNAEWATFSLLYKGENFNQTLTPTIMQGLVDYQFAIYRSVALIIKNKNGANSLTDEEKASFELLFEVKSGSTDLLAKAGDLLQGVCDRTLGRMTGKETLICILVLGAFGLAGFGANAYLSNVAEVKKIEAQSERESGLHKIIKQMNESEIDKLKIIKDITEKIPKAGLIINEINGGLDSVIRRSQSAEQVVIQGVVIDRETMGEITAIRQRQSQNVIIKEDFYVDGTDVPDDGEFIVKLRDAKTNKAITASLPDPFVQEKYLPQLQKAEAKRTKVRAHVQGKKLGEDIVNATVIKVTSARSKKIKD